MRNRRSLHDELVAILGTRNVYFQPPETIKMMYPCIIYKKNNIQTRYANDKRYASMNEYAITVVSKDPDNEIAEALLRRFSFCRFDRRFTADNLYHDVLTLYY